MSTQRPSKDEIEKLLEPTSADIALAKEVLIVVLCEQIVADKNELLGAVLSSQEMALGPSVTEDWSWEEQVRTYRWVATARLALAELQGEALQKEV